VKISSVTIFDISIPLRLAFRHSKAERDRSRNVVVRVELDNGAVGYGEGVPVAYVTGETSESVVAAVRDRYFPALRGRSFATYEQLGRALLEIGPVVEGGVCHTSAKCAFELAVLDACGRAFGHSIDHLAPLLGAVGPAAGPSRPPRYGVALTADREWIRKRLRLLRLYGFRDFKLKVGLDPKADLENVALAARLLRRRLLRPRATLRVDANCAYPDPEAALRALEPLVRLGVECVEQPMGPENDDLVVGLARRLGVPILLDESVRTLGEAERFVSADPPVGVNVRLSKNGGFFDSLRIIALCRRRGAPFQLGCHVGETGILAAAQRRLVGLAPDARYIEGAFGTHLLEEDVICGRVRFGFGGRPPKVGPVGLGVEVDEGRLRKFLLGSVRFQ